MGSVVNAIELIITNQRNDFLIQWEEGKTRQPKRCKDKLYAEICCQITPHAMREISKQVEKIWIGSEKQEPLPVCTNSFRKTMQLPCAYDINRYISQKKSIPFDDCHYHWRLVRCPIWDSRWSKGLDESWNGSPDGSPNRSPDLSNANQKHKSATQNASPEPTLLKLRLIGKRRTPILDFETLNSLYKVTISLPGL